MVWGDVRDLIAQTLENNAFEAATIWAGLVPVWGDAERIVTKAAIRIANGTSRVSQGIARFLLREYPGYAQVKALIRSSAKRLPRDAAVAGRRAPAANLVFRKANQPTGTGWAPGDPLPSRISSSSEQEQALRAELNRLYVYEQVNPGSISDIRINQTQVDGDKVRAGINRPDLQYSVGTEPNVERYYVEFDRPWCSNMSTSRRGPDHQARILANDESSATVFVYLILAGSCE
jgi:hypothetical protein